MIRFEVLGVPQPGGSKSAFPLRHRDGSPVLRENGSQAMSVRDANPKVKDWRVAVVAAARRVHTGALLDGPLSVTFLFTVPRPKGHYGKRGLLLSAPAFPAVKPDVLKLARSCEDALSKVIWRDDAQIVTELLKKRYGEPARVEVTIEPASAAETRPLQGPDRSDVRAAHGLALRGKGGAEEEGQLALSLLVRDGETGHGDPAAIRDAELRVPAPRGDWRSTSDAREQQDARVPDLPQAHRTLRDGDESVLPGLRGPRDSGLREVAPVVRGVPGGHGQAAISGARDRSNRRERGLPSRELPVGDPHDKRAKQAGAQVGDDERSDDVRLGVGGSDRASEVHDREASRLGVDAGGRSDDAEARLDPPEGVAQEAPAPPGLEAFTRLEAGLERPTLALAPSLPPAARQAPDEALPLFAAVGGRV